jgi:hypothetical protein
MDGDWFDKWLELDETVQLMAVLLRLLNSKIVSGSKPRTSRTKADQVCAVISFSVRYFLAQ